MTTLLCIDTSSASCSVALAVDGEHYFEIENKPQAHSERVLEMCDNLLRKHNIRISDVDALGVSQGPGSFTGVRIGISVAQGIAFAANLPVIPVSSLALMAQKTFELHNSRQVLCLSDARMSEIYFGRFTLQNGLMMAADNEGLCSPATIDFQFDDKWVSCGNAWLEYEKELASFSKQFEQIYPDIIVSADSIIPYAEHYLKSNQTVSAPDLQPVYLRNQVAHKAKSK